MKLAIHSHAVTQMFGYGQSMVILDKTGKALVFVPDPQGDSDVRSCSHIPSRGLCASRTNRTLQRSLQANSGHQRATRQARTPRARRRGVRVYDIFTPGAAGKSLLPTEHLGAVMYGTILLTQSNRVYLRHEAGNISIWTLDTEGGMPGCDEIVKVSTSDIFPLRASTTVSGLGRARTRSWHTT